MSSRPQLFRFAFAVPPALLLLGACGDSDDPTGVTGGPTIRFLSGATGTDTIGQQLPSRLVIEVIDSAGQPAADVAVRFSSEPLPQPPFCSLFGSCQARAAVSAPDARTDSTGQLATLVRLGTVAGVGRLLVSVPSLGVEATAEYTVQPGRPARVGIAPVDTFVYLDTDLQFDAAVIDRAGNRRPEPAALEAPEAIPVSGTSVRAAAYGVHQIVARSGPNNATTKLSVVPRGTIAALERYWPVAPVIVVFDLDGTVRARYTLDRDVNGLAWTPDGSAIVFSKASATLGYQLHSVPFPTGNPALVFPTRTAKDEQRPTFSRDGRWLYFAENPGGLNDWRLWRARADGSSLEPVGGIFTSSSGPLRSSLGPSPDGARVAYARSVCCSPSATLLNVVDVATGAASELQLRVEGARWSPDGSRIAYPTQTGPGIVNPDGSGDRRFQQGPIGYADISLDWSPDGRWLISRTAGPLNLLEIESGLRIPLTYLPAAYQPSWKP